METDVVVEIRHWRAGACATLLLGLIASWSPGSRAATIVPPADLGELGRRAGAVVLATAVGAEPIQRGPLLFTDTRFHVQEPISGPIARGEEILVEAPGGERDGHGWAVAGSPRFETGTTYLLFLTAATNRRWQPAVLSWGVLRRVTTDALGNVLVPLEEVQELSALPRPDGLVAEAPQPMLEGPLVEHLGAVVRNRAKWDAGPLLAPRTLLPTSSSVETLSVPSGCSFMSGSSGNLRWRVFDSGGSATMSAALPGDSSLAGGGFTQVQGALNAWNGVPSTSMRLTYGGQVSYTLTCTSGQDTPGSGNPVVVFNDPCSDIADLSGCSGTLAFGGPWYGATHTFDGTTWMTITSWFVVVNNGAGCLGASNYQLMLAHELGHGLGFNHVSDPNALMYYMCCHPVDSTDRLCAQYVYPSTTPPPAPVAAFTFSPSSPVAGQAVYFTDTSANSPTSWSWTFGDGGTSTAQNPSHAYASAGTFNVTLTATNSGGSNAVTKQVSVSAPPVPTAGFTFSPSSPVVGQTVQFVDASAGSPTSWSWTFGDGWTSTAQNPAHAFTSAGSFVVTLVATNASGSSQKQRSVTVSQPAAPVASFAYTPASPLVGQLVTFLDQSTGGPTSWSWSFGDGTTSVAANPVKSWASAGTYSVTLQVSNANGSSSASKQVVVSAAGVAPVASFSFTPTSPVAGEVVRFTDTSSGGPAAWSWDFGDGTSSTQQNPAKSYASVGAATVRLTAANAYGSSTTTRSITIAAVPNQPPVATADTYSVTAGTSLTVGPPGVLGNDSDPDGGSLTAVLASPPGKGSFGLQPSGAFSYTPVAGFIGTDSFSYRAVDAQGLSSEAVNVSLVVSGAESERVVPIVLDAYGVGTSRFRSELVLANRGATTASLELTYTAASALNASGSGVVNETLGPGRQLVLDDALAWLRNHGLAIPAAAPGASQGGALRVRFRNLSTAAAGAAFARTTALLPEGRAGVAYPALSPADWTAASAQNVFGLRETAEERSNLALVNLGSTGDVGLRVTLYSGNASDGRSFVRADTIWLHPQQWTQLGSVLSLAGFTSGWARVERVSGSEPFYAYGVFNDSVTNDGSFIDPVPAAASEAVRAVPVVLELGIYSTELILANPSDSSVDVSLRYVESRSAQGASRLAGSDVLRPREQKVVDAIPYLRTLGVDVGPIGGSYAGSLFVAFSATGRPATGFAGARTKSPGSSGGTYGVYYSGLGAGQVAQSDAWVFGLKQDAESRTNVAVAQAEVGGTPIVAQAEIFDGDTGKSLGGTGNVSLNPGQWFQWNQILSGFGIRQGYARVFRLSGTSPFLAYGVVNDGGTGRTGTNDGSYVPMLPGR